MTTIRRRYYLMGSGSLGFIEGWIYHTMELTASQSVPIGWEIAP